ncbi:MAG: hypothetical protein BECKG1743D_GA0114223_101821 [Candidatus Kentron sp. G]|nr:MAG: hypothetical protein BECKG1743D_GA0114223_101821 [Candidatus Kentron sp. G]
MLIYCLTENGETSVILLSVHFLFFLYAFHAAISIRRLAEKNIPNCAGFSSGFKARGRRIVHYVTVIATQKLDDKDKQVGIFFDRNRLRYWFAIDIAIDPVRLFR